MAVTIAAPTGLAPGTYCDVLTGGKSGAACAGTSVTVDAIGAVNLTVGPMTAVAIHAGTRL
jgi:alpha-amylase